MGDFLIRLNKISIVIPIMLTCLMLFLHFMEGAIQASKMEMANQRMERLGQLSFVELGQIKVKNAAL